MNTVIPWRALLHAIHLLSPISTVLRSWVPRPAALCLLIYTSLLPSPSPAQNRLPSGFGGVTVGMPWEQIAHQHPLHTLNTSGAAFDQYALACGYRTAVIKLAQAKLLLTANDNVVTEVTYITEIEAGTDLVAAADQIIGDYGQPSRVSMRDLSGRATLDRRDVNYVNLVYGGKRQVEFNLTGRELWKYQVGVRSEHYHWHQNKTLRCAREKEKRARSGHSSRPVN